MHSNANHAECLSGMCFGCNKMVGGLQCNMQPETATGALLNDDNLYLEQFGVLLFPLLNGLPQPCKLGFALLDVLHAQPAWCIQNQAHHSDPCIPLDPSPGAGKQVQHGIVLLQCRRDKCGLALTKGPSL